MRSLANLDVNEVAIHLALARVARTCTATAPNQLPDVLRLVSFSLVSLSLLVGASWVSRTGGVPRRTPGARERDTRARERHQATTNGKYTEPFFASSLFRSFALSLFRSFAACCSLYRPQAIDAYFNHPQALDSYLNHHQVIDSYLNLHQVIDSYLNHHQVIDSYLNHHQAIDSYLNQGSPTQASVATAEMMSRCQRAIDHAVRTGTPRYRCVASTPSICSSSAQLHQIPRSACCSRPSLARVARRRATTGTRRSRRSGASLPRSTAATATHRNQADPQASFRVYRAQAQRVASFDRDTECWCAPTTCRSPTARSRRPYATS